MEIQPSKTFRIALAFFLAALSASVQAKLSAAEVMARLDSDRNGSISRQEWRKKRIFDKVDLDGDGAITLIELQIRFGERAPDPASGIEMPDPVSISAIRRGRRDDVRDQKRRGLFETGLHPVWGEEVHCRGIDEWFAKDYTPKRPREAYHGGIDIPAPYDTPIRAVMDGVVIALYEGESNPRGIEVVMRHTPQESGLPFYLYSRYTHFRKMPDLRVGQRLNMGDIIGPTGNTGVLSCELKHEICRGSRRPAIHFDILYSTDERYYDSGTQVIPFQAHWMDPNALYRKTVPVDSESMRALPQEQKAVPISYMLDNGEFYPPDTRMIWPYACHLKRAR